MALNPKNITPGTEQHEMFTRKIGRQTKRYCAYDYRHTNGVLFSTVKPTLQACVDARDEWLADNYDSHIAAQERIADEVIDHMRDGDEYDARRAEV